MGAGIFHAAGALAGPIEVDAGRCANAIRVKAHDAPLADVLARMSDATGFRLDATVDLSERVTLDKKGPPERLLKNLLLGKNVVIQTAASAACGGQDRIQTVWILPAGQDAPRGVAPQRVETSPAERPRGTRKKMSEQEWQLMKQGYQAGKIKADPQTGKPVPVDPSEQPASTPQGDK